MTAQRQIADNLLKLSEIKNNISFVFYLLPKPAERTLAILNRQTEAAVNPFQFMAYGFGVLIITQAGGSVFESKYQFLEGILLSVLMVGFLLGTYWITYYIFKDVSRAGKTYDEFLEMCAFTSGLTWILQGGGWLAGLMNEGLGIIVGLGVFIYTSVYTLRVWKPFWDLPYSKIIIYSILVGVAMMIALFLVIAVLAAVFGVFGAF